MSKAICWYPFSNSATLCTQCVHNEKDYG